MSKVYLVCTPAGICTSMLCYVLNQSRDCYSEPTSEVFRPCINLFIDKIFSEDDYEKSDLTVNDRWNFPEFVQPEQRKKYTHEIRNNNRITKEQAQWAVDVFGSGDRDMILFSHAHNISEIYDYQIPNLTVIQAVHGHNFQKFISLWLGRNVIGYYHQPNYAEVMNWPAEKWVEKLKSQTDYWSGLSDSRVQTVALHEWLVDDLSEVYDKLNIALPLDIQTVKYTIDYYIKENRYEHALVDSIVEYILDNQPNL